MLTPLVEARPSSLRGNLQIDLDDEFGMLSLKGDLREPAPIGLNFDGLLICDLASDGVFTTIELVIRRSHWETRSGLAQQLPDAGNRAVSDVAARSLALGSYFYECPVHALLDPQASILVISVGTISLGELGDDLIRVSAQAGIITKDGRFVGCIAKLAA